MSYIDLSIVALYLIGTFIVGLYYGKREGKSLQQFATGNKDFSVPLIAITIFATLTGGNNVLGNSEKGFRYGIIFYLIVFGDPVYRLIMAKYFAPRFSRFRDCISAGDILDKSFGRLGRCIAGVAAFMKCSGSVAAQIAGLSIVLQYMSGIDYFTGLVIVTFLTIAYSAFGGITSVVFTDVIQFVALIIAVPLVSALAVHKAGGANVVFETTFITKPDFSFEDGSFIFTIFMIYCIPELNPVLLHRLLISRNLRFLSASLRAAAALAVPFGLVMALLVGSAYILDPTIEPKSVYPYLIDTILPVGLKGIAIAGLFAILMSTIDSFLNTASVAFAQDILEGFFPKKFNDQTKKKYAQSTTVIIGAIGFYIATQYNSIVSIFLFSMELWVPLMVAPLYSVIFRYNATQKDLIFSCLGGVVALYSVKFSPLGKIPGLTVFAAYLGSFLMMFRRALTFKNLKELLTRPARPRSIALAEKKRYIVPQNIDAFCILIVFFYAFSPFLGIYENKNLLWLGMHVLGVSSALALFFGRRNNFSFKPLIQPFVIMTGALIPFLMVHVSGKLETLFFIMPIFLYFSSMIAFSKFFQGIAFSFTLSKFVTYYYIGLPGLGAFYEVAFLSTVLISGFFISRLTFHNPRERYQGAAIAISEIAHEVRTPLQSIAVDFGMLIEELGIGKKESPNPLIGKIYHKLNTVFSSLELILQTFRKDDKNDQYEIINLSNLLQNIIEQYSFPKDVHVTIDAQCQNLHVKGDEAALRGVFLNLIKNSVEAQYGQDKKEVNLTLKQSANYATIFVEDRGPGVDLKDSEVIFEPFYTTKKSGTGVGLSYCLKIIQNQSGSMFYEPRPGGGARFVVQLPVGS